MSDPAYEFGVVCEAPADRETGCSLADRVLVQNIPWLETEMLDMQRRWQGLTPQASCLLWRLVDDEVALAGLKYVVYGHFDGASGAEDALTARKALMLFARLDKPPSAVLLLRDSDGSSERRTGLEQARANKDWPFEVVIGVAEPKRECWILVAFEPRSKQENSRLFEVERRLSFNPVRDAHRLDAEKHGAKNDAKKALSELTEDDKIRERECLSDASLDMLRTRGERVGLTQFLMEVRKRLVRVMDNEQPYT